MPKRQAKIDEYMDRHVKSDSEIESQNSEDDDASTITKPAVYKKRSAKKNKSNVKKLKNSGKF